MIEPAVGAQITWTQKTIGQDTGETSLTVYSSLVCLWSALTSAGYPPNSSPQHLATKSSPSPITVMPATRYTTVDEPRSTTPYSLSGALQPQLTALTGNRTLNTLSYKPPERNLS